MILNRTSEDRRLKADLTQTGTARRWTPTVAAVATVLTLAGCASTPAPNAELDATREAWQTARSDTSQVERAPIEFQKAGAAVNRAEETWRSGADRAEVDHQAKIARLELDLALATAQRKEVERSIEQASRERDAIQLEMTRRQASAAQSQAEALESQNAALRSATDEAQARADELARRLQAMQAKQTERGLVVTFSDVLFDVGRADLRPMAMQRIEELASIMKEYTERNVLLEGFTDSTGSNATNQELSERRAMAVREVLVMQGIPPNRIVTRGLGSRYPVADNSTTIGRQQNRRVEAILSDANGVLPFRN